MAAPRVYPSSALINYFWWVQGIRMGWDAGNQTWVCQVKGKSSNPFWYFLTEMAEKVVRLSARR